jgi:hypothetical protein
MRGKSSRCSICNIGSDYNTGRQPMLVRYFCNGRPGAAGSIYTNSAIVRFFPDGKSRCACSGFSNIIAGRISTGKANALKPFQVQPAFIGCSPGVFVCANIKIS